MAWPEGDEACPGSSGGSDEFDEIGGLNGKCAASSFGHMKLSMFLIIDNVAKLLERRPTDARVQRHYSSLLNRDVPTT
jgi:hypothetical protein